MKNPIAEINKRFAADLRQLTYHAEANPLTDNFVVPTRNRRVQSILTTRPLLDAETGERVNAKDASLTTYLRSIQECDAEQYVKVFTAGINAMYQLTRTAQRVFQIVLALYEAEPITKQKQWIDTVYIPPATQLKADIHEATFNKGLRELLDKQFIAPKTPNFYWINPALFIKGNRLTLISEYRKKS